MKNVTISLICILWLITSVSLFGQSSPNCFLEDYYPKYSTAPLYIDVAKTTAAPTVTVTVNGNDTLGKISNYILGNAAAVWVGQNINNPTLVKYLQMLSPSLVRFPGGSWSDVYFRDGNPGDLPDSIHDGTTGKKTKFYPQIGSWYSLTPESYYNLRDQIGAQGLITVNYGYARYGLGANPVAQAAHLAADWVRYDAGRTQFWEVGNENGGPWEAGWQIDPAVNKDGQPDTITGALYGKHFKIFVDSMKAAAAILGVTIYVGGQVIHFDGTTSWNIPDRKWNEGFFKEAGDAADFYVMHNYYGNTGITPLFQINAGRNDIINNINFIRGDIASKGASSKPIAITEWNCGGPDAAKTSVANGMQAVVQFCEMIKNNVGMSSRWLIANWDKDGMFYYKNPVDAGIPLWNPRPDFYYIYYLRQFIGDHAVNASITGSGDILAYASTFTSGHTGVVVVNKGSVEQVVKLDPNSIGVGNKFYVYTLTGIDKTTFPQSVVVNETTPTGAAWGPLDSLKNIRARAYPIGDTIRFVSPPLSVQFILTDNGSRIISAVEEPTDRTVKQFSLHQNYPNPFNPQTTISYSLPRTSNVSLRVYDVLGREVATLVNNDKITAGSHEISFDASSLPSGVFFYRLQTGGFAETKRMIVIK